MRRIPLRPLHIILTGMLLAAGIGWVAFYVRLGQPLARLSYDMMFLFRGDNLSTPEVQLVDMDEESDKVLKQPRSGIWNRSVHARLLRRLTHEGARAVFFDVLFTDESEESGGDEDFAAAIGENGKVFLGWGILQKQTIKNVNTPSAVVAKQQSLMPPIPILRRAARGSGSLGLNTDRDNAVRRISSAANQIPASTWILAEFLGAHLPDDYEEPLRDRWLNYYGHAGTIQHISYFQALDSEIVAEGFFKDKIVFIGGRNRLANLYTFSDQFGDPWTRWGGDFMPGVEVHANTLLNLLHENWLTRGDEWTEGTFIIVVGIVVGGLLARLRPLMAAFAGLVFAVATLWGALWWLDHYNVWYNWLVPVAVQTPVAVAWSWAANYSLEARKRARTRKGSERFLPPEILDQIDEGEEFQPGGKRVEATMIFTDLKDSVTLSESLDDADAFSVLLNEYYSNISQHVRANHGTIIRYQGDGVFAAWGAPTPDRDHARDAVVAAWEMHRASQIEVRGCKLITRVGINTGEVSAGNLGSKDRVDYTLIGDPVNVASRLEGLNKQLGTSVLMADSTHAKLDGRFTTRCLGKFILVGKKTQITVHELLGPAANSADFPWRETFARALAAFQRRDLETAAILFQQVHDERAAVDGPSQFYLKEIARLGDEGFPDDWSGAVGLVSK